MSQTRVSVVLCTFNGERFLGEQLKSLAAQDRLPDELIVYDDVSEDRTLERLSEFGACAPFEVRIALNGRRVGPTRNFEQASRAATGDIILFCDQDDRWYPTKISAVLSAFHGRPDVLCVISNADLVDAAGRPLGLSLWEQLGFPGGPGTMSRDWQRNWLLRRTIAFGSVMGIRTGLLEKALPVPLPSGHDNWAALMAAGLGRVRLLSQPLIAYRQHAGQVSSATPRSIARRIKGFRPPADPLSIRPTEETFRALAGRLRHHANGAVEPAAALWFAAAAESKAEHLSVRARLPGRMRDRLAPILSELRDRRYHHYSNGLASAARDILWGCP